MRAGAGLAAFVVASAAIVGCTSATESSTVPTTSTAAEVPTAGPLQVGVAVPRSRAETVAALEAEVGMPFDVIRMFRRWEDPIPNEDIEALLATGHRLHLSVRPLRKDGSAIAWADLATTRPGDPLHVELQEWVDDVVAFPPGTYFTVSHEPEAREAAVNGTSADFVAMWRRMATMLRESGGDHIRLVWTMTGGSFGDERAEQWYPGDAYVDVIGTDSYNWFTCQGTERPWYELRQLLFQPLAFARERRKPLAVPEFASAEDPADPGRRVQWLRNATEFLQEPEVVESLEFIAWFNVTAPGGTWPDCVWDHDTTPESAVAFAEMMRTVSGR